MSRNPSGESSLRREQNLSWNVHVPTKSSRTSKELKIAPSHVTKSTVLATVKEKYQFISSPCTRRITKVSQLERILAEKGVNLSEVLGVPARGRIALNSDVSFLSLELFDDWEYDPFHAELADFWRGAEAFAFIPSTLRWQRVTVENQQTDANLWEVKELAGPGAGSLHWMPRLQLYFLFEDPGKFVDRIASAIAMRREAENAIRFRFLCKHIANYDHYAPGARLAEGIRKRSASEEVYEVFKKIYRDYHVGLILGKHLKQETTIAIKEPASWPPTSIRSSPQMLFSEMEKVNIAELLDRFLHNTFLVDRNVFNALRLVNHECEIVRKLPLFVTTFEQSTTLDEFEKQNHVQTARSLKYLQNAWIERTVMHLHRALSRVGPGDFDIGVSRWKTYHRIKLTRLISQIQYRMQDALRDLMLDSTGAYVEFLINDCSAVLALPGCDYSWDGNLIDSPFVPKRPPIFALTLEMGPEVPYYSTEPDRFPQLLQGLMDDTVEQSHYIHTVEPSLIQSLIFAENLYLSSVGILDPAVVDRRDRLMDYYSKALLPLRAYAARYAAYRDLFFTNVSDFIERLKAEDKSSSEIKEDIALQIRLRENLEHTVPLDIVIGPFLIDVQPLREALIRKRYELTVALLKMLTEKLRLKTAGVIADYSAINERICEKPVAIEHIFDIRQYMEAVPDTVGRMEDRMKGILFEYEILEGFLWNLPDADFEQKWNALAFPRTVLKQMVTVREFHETQVEKFRKQQFADEASYTASVEDINAYISKFTTLYDVAKVSEMAVEVRRLWKALQALIDQGHTLNRRQELFEMNPISLNNLFELRDNFRAYRDLWTVAADYLKLEESWIGNPLASVDLDGVRRSLQQTQDAMGDLRPLFLDQKQLLAVVEHFLRVVDEFRPNLDIMALLKCPYLEAIHWGQLAKEAGIKGKLSVDVGYDVLLEHDIRGHVDTIRKIVSKAEELRLEQEQRRQEEDRIRREEEEYRRIRAERRLKRTDI